MDKSQYIEVTEEMVRAGLHTLLYEMVTGLTLPIPSLERFFWLARSQYISSGDSRDLSSNWKRYCL